MDIDGLPHARQEEDSFEALKFFLGQSKSIDAFVTSKKTPLVPTDLVPTIKLQSRRCREEFEKYSNANNEDDVSDDKLRELCRFTDGMPLWDFRRALHLVPALVNVVSVTNDILTTH